LGGWRALTAEQGYEVWDHADRGLPTAHCPLGEGWRSLPRPPGLVPGHLKEPFVLPTEVTGVKANSRQI